MVTALYLLAALPAVALAGDVLQTNGFSSCQNNATVHVKKMNVQYNRASQLVDFDVAGVSDEEQKVMMTLTVTAYGNVIYTKEMNPCDKTSGTYYKGLCPIPKGTFAAAGHQQIPDQYAGMVPDIAFNIPDLAGEATLTLKSVDSGKNLACIESQVGNGKTMKVAAVSYVVAGMLGASLLLSGVSALGAGGGAGGATPSPTFGEVFGWFHSMAMNGMLTVSYPAVYQSFATNFGFTTGLVPWTSMQRSIDSFRASTGGNLYHDNVDYLQNATLVHKEIPTDQGLLARRSLEVLSLFIRDISTNVNGTKTGKAPADDDDSGQNHLVSGIQGYVEELTIPQANTFMTVLLIFAIVIAAITVGILLFKVILEAWALFGTFPKKLTGFRKRYWWLLAKTITNLILLLYGVWTLYCVYQFTNGDSWAAKVLAGVTLGVFTAILAFFTWRIYSLAHKFKRSEGDSAQLFEDKETWRKYSLFYENYKKGYWWLFVPAIVYMFAKGVVIAAGNGHGLIQTGGQLIVESLLLILLLWTRPFSLKSGNWINIIIQIVRVLSVCCILVFVEELGVAQSTQTITGVVLIVMQCVLTGLLGILIAVNSLVICCKENPHRRRRKDAEKMQRDLDNLTPLDARNSLLMDPTDYKGAGPFVSATPLGSHRGYDPVPNPQNPQSAYSPSPMYGSDASQSLLGDAGTMGHRHDRSLSPTGFRAPRLPEVETQHSPYGRAF